MTATPENHLTVGVLALQGAFREHGEALEKCGAIARQVRRRRELAGLDALVIPGGESTTIGKLMVSYHMLDEIKGLGAEGLPIFGTCAGLVMLAREVAEGDQPLLGLMDITVRRNAFGRQVKSFEAPLEIRFPAAAGEKPAAPKVLPFPGIFIRAPWIESAGAGVEILAEHEGHGVAALQDRMLVTAFHPELTGDLRLHELFLRIAAG
ncbi:MAG: pyridoxal 5'-phosphate synthase glutaminase subunit PdxT [Actinobacteria bacterium]|nr:pyridoxal 5'-phosphate synthase glutaminase subunit PdxT [Actinomycetota bacterium]MCL5883117.1 pyridoxal 5'-phosphate synthase glutaminase subunit PdxT [Actinomycetota bacterium]